MDNQITPEPVIERLVQLEAELNLARAKLPEDLQSFDKLLNSIDHLNKLTNLRDQTKLELMATIKVLENEEKLEEQLRIIIQEAYEAAKSEPTFFVGVSGGSFPPLLVKVLKQLQDIDWKKWMFFFCDERCVSFGSGESTFGVFKRLLEPVDAKLPLSLSQFITIDPSLRGGKVADDYLSKMRQRFDATRMPRFHILFLGVGPDGHTCSLFPGHRLLKETTKWIAHLSDSPKPPPERVTMTLGIVNNAKNCVFVAQGEGKAQIIKEILEDKNMTLPAAMVQPHSGKLYWLLDQPAGSKLKRVLQE